MFCDLDRFKVVNDNLGHATGNELLTIVAGRLREALPDDALAARLGGDEFAILLADATREEALTVAHAIRGRLVEPVAIQGRTVHIDVSIGVAHYPDDGHDPDALVRAADTAMYSAKDLGRGRAVVHTSALRDEMQSRFDLETDLHHAVDGGQLHLVYQPRVDLRSGEIIGAEALLRWHHPQRGYISPTSFIPIAEDSGLIVPIGEWVLDRACAQAAYWQQAGLPKIPIAVNVSGVQFQRQDLRDVVKSKLEAYRIEPALLHIEITETVIVSARERAVELLTELRSLGVRLALDDFGTGYSSLSYLKNFPIDTLKIDRSFVAEMLTDHTTASIIEAIISMTRVLGLSVIAEGVEDQAQFAFLQTIGCDAVQGFYVSAAVPAHEFAKMLSDFDSATLLPARMRIAASKA
jgi:diguanylate cyclase (GGDEF)-like protein